jgi:hypothetical protein
MKHYLYQVFNKTLAATVKRYLAKYGTQATIAQSALKLVRPGESALGFTFDPNDVLARGATVTRPALKANEETHDDVILNGRWSGTPPGLTRVKPWDVLILLAHGGLRANQTIITNTCYSDDDANGTSESRTVNGLVDWFGPKQDNLDKDHVLIKLAICYSGGRGGSDPVGSDCFAKNLATALRKEGWMNIAVGGYKGAIDTPKVAMQGAGQQPPGGKFSYTDINIQLPPRTVQHVGATNSLPGKDNLVYFKGDGSILEDKELNLVKVILRNFPAQRSVNEQVDYVKNMIVGVNKKDASMLQKFPGEVLKMLKKRLGIGPSSSQPPPAQPTQVQGQPKKQ